MKGLKKKAKKSPHSGAVKKTLGKKSTKILRNSVRKIVRKSNHKKANAHARKHVKKNSWKITHKKVRDKHKKISEHKNKFLKKSMVEPRVPTGISNFDSLIEGGFEKNSTNLVVGGSGSGKTIFSTQFLIEGLKKGENCLYITFEEKKAQFYENMKDFGWDLEGYEKKGLFTFLEYSPSKVKTMLEEGGGAIESIILKKKINRMIIDSISSFALLFEDSLARRDAALSLFNMIRGWKATALLSLEEEAIFGAGVSPDAMKFEADSLIALYYMRKGNKRSRFLEVLKMRGTKHSDRVYSFEIGKRGIEIAKIPVKGSFER